MTPEEIEITAKNLGAKYAVTIEEDNKILYLKAPSKIIYEAWLDTFDNNPRLAAETVIKSLVIKEVSDMDVLEDFKSLGSVFGQLKEIMALKKSSLKTL